MKVNGETRELNKRLAKYLLRPGRRVALTFSPVGKKLPLSGMSSSSFAAPIVNNPPAEREA